MACERGNGVGGGNIVCYITSTLHFKERKVDRDNIRRTHQLYRSKQVLHVIGACAQAWCTFILTPPSIPLQSFHYIQNSTDTLTSTLITVGCHCFTKGKRRGFGRKHGNKPFLGIIPRKIRYMLNVHNGNIQFQREIWQFHSPRHTTPHRHARKSTTWSDAWLGIYIYINWQHDTEVTTMCDTAVHYRILQHTTRYYKTQQDTTGYYKTLQDTTQHCPTLHDMTLHAALHDTVWHCMTLHDIAWHYMTLHDTT